MVKLVRRLLLAISLVITLCSCSDAADNYGINKTGKGARQGMKTYYIGRFAVDVPEEFNLEVQSHRLRLIKIEEFANLPDAEKKWKDHLDTIELLRKPIGVDKIVMRVQQFEGMGAWAKGVLYYGDRMTDKECNWDIFVSHGNSGILFSLNGRLEKEQSMLAWLQVVARAYAPNPKMKLLKPGLFHTRHGAIDLPYKRQEQSYARFKGPMEMVIRIEMRETHKVEESGVMDRLLASLAVNFAPGVDVDKIRARQRIVAGFRGQEIVTRFTDKNGKELFFAWDYQGKVDSGEEPEIKVGIETEDGKLDEKLRVWENVLDSLRPAFDSL